MSPAEGADWPRSTFSAPPILAISRSSTTKTQAASRQTPPANAPSASLAHGVVESSFTATSVTPNAQPRIKTRRNAVTQKLWSEQWQYLPAAQNNNPESSRNRIVLAIAAPAIPHRGISTPQSTA